MSLYRKIVIKISDIFEMFAVFCLVTMVVVVFVQVIGRYVFANTPRWSEEIARQCMIIFTFIGMAIGVRDKIHIGLTIVVDSLNIKIRLPIEILGKLFIMTFGVMISINMGLLFSMLRHNRLPGTGIPILYIYAFPTLIGVLIASIAAYQIYDHFRFGTDEEQEKLLEASAGASIASTEEGTIK